MLTVVVMVVVVVVVVAMVMTMMNQRSTYCTQIQLHFRDL
jgi:hypothetical protein